MLTIKVEDATLFDENTNTFVVVKPTVLQLEHSLISISKWEAKYHKPFLTKEAKTTEETMDYIKCMTITKNVSDNVYLNISNESMQKILEYIDDAMTATTFTSFQQSKMSKEVITNELVYYWMIVYKIPYDYQKWHLNRLLTLIKVCGIKNQPPKKINQMILKKETELIKKDLIV